MTLNFTGYDTQRTVGDVVTAARALLNAPLPAIGTSLSRTVSLHTIGDLLIGVREQLLDTSPDTGTSAAGTTVIHTIGDLVARAREILSDDVQIGTDPAYRYPDPLLYDHVTDAVIYLHRYRPDLFITDTVVGFQAVKYTPANANTTFPISEDLFPGVAKYVASQALQRDDPNAEESEGSSLQKMFMMDMKSTPFRHSTVMLMRFFTDAILHIRRFRPELFVTQGALVGFYTDPTMPFPITDEYFGTVKNYIIAQCRRRNAQMLEGADPVDAQLSEGFIKELTSGPGFYDDAVLYRYVGEALTIFRARRPDLFMGVLRVTLPVYSYISDTATPFPLADQYYNAVVSFLVARSLMRDDPSKDGGWVAYMSQFTNAIASG